jgi:hypothetical protein
MLPDMTEDAECAAIYASWAMDLIPLRTAGEISNAFMCSPKTCWKVRTACSITVSRAIERVR